MRFRLSRGSLLRLSPYRGFLGSRSAYRVSRHIAAFAAYHALALSLDNRDFLGSSRLAAFLCGSPFSNMVYKQWFYRLRLSAYRVWLWQLLAALQLCGFLGSPRLLSPAYRGFVATVAAYH
jgi:hypothetical protein